MIYDPFQKNAIDCIKHGTSVIVSAPTGSGKTVIAEYVLSTCIAQNKRAVYTAPIKALSNQKFRDFYAQFQDKIGLLTGDVSINPDAPILIMTTEIFRNKLLTEKAELENYSWVIFDEIHYIDDYERGTVWEESLIFLPQHMKMLALSATIPNIDELAEWLRVIHKKPLHVIKETTRPVPLHFFYQCQNETFDNINKIKGLHYKNVPRLSSRGRKSRDTALSIPNRPISLVKHLEKADRLPAIYFAFGRRRCESLAQEMIHFDFLSGGEKAEVLSFYDGLMVKFDLLGEKSAQEMRPLIQRGIAYHHAGMLPTLKEVIERLFTSRQIKIIFTTETFALGINMPARTVVFDELTKYYGRFHDILKTRDFYQMAGRAGRRGIDEEGFVYSRVNQNRTSYQDLHRIIFGNPEKVRSKLNASYATILNLYDHYGENLYDIYPRSFHYFQETKSARKKALDVMHSKVDLLKQLGYISPEGLTEKGRFACNIYGYELPLGELYEQGILEQLSETELGILCVSLVFEPRKGCVCPRLSAAGQSLQALCSPLTRNIHNIEKRADISPPSKKFYYHLSAGVESWLNKESFEKVCAHTAADEGEIVRYFRMAVQILREILDAPVSPHLKAKLKHTIAAINYGIVDAEKQLRG